MAASERGFGMVEALLALTIWAVAMLALAGVQGRMLLEARDAEAQDRIEEAVSNLAQAMHSGPEAWLPHYLEGAYDDDGRPAADCVADCSAEQFAAAGLARFRRELREIGRGVRASGVVCRADRRTRPRQGAPACDGRGPLAIRVAWRSRRGGAWREHAGVWPLQP
ncbi:type IV pilus modification PilV family protein [Chromobacterium sp. CV08]|uniref:type IV pilus modification PilV family protein n=1 Tax=Chromobacterium sp. CV08 TaxID=3133274 RepID=UPI003DA8323D